MAYKYYTTTITTDASGDATGYLPENASDADNHPGTVNGKIITLIYTKTDYAIGVDFDVTLERTGEIVLAKDNVNASATYAPRQATHGTDGNPNFYNDEGDEPVHDYICAANDRLKIVVDEGGNAKTGQFEVIVEE